MDQLFTVSIIVNNYNYGRFLGRAIDSALAQTYAHTEVIVVDDGSTDDSRQVIARYGDRVIPVLKANGGQASAFNAGFARSRGEVVILLDSDDLLLPTAVEQAVPFFQDSAVSKVHWPLQVIDAAGNSRGQLVAGPGLSEGDLRAEAVRKGPGAFSSAPTSGNAWARWFLHRVLPIDEPTYRTMADMPLIDAAPFFGILRAIRQPLSCYRVHGTNVHSARPIEAEVARLLPMSDCSLRFLTDQCRQAGHAVNLKEWERHSWWHKTDRLVRIIAGLPAPSTPVILLDGGGLNEGPIAGHPRWPFPEHNGQYWGPPADDAVAVAELERLRASGGAFLVVAFVAFWWLEHYAAFAAHLRRAYTCVSNDDDAIVFDLRARRE